MLPRKNAMSRVNPVPLRHERIESFPSRYLGTTRPIDVLLPLGYDQRSHERFGLLILNDGQELAALHLPTTLTHLQSEQRIAPLVVVAVHATRDRLIEYGTLGTPNCYGQGARAGGYRAFLRDELLPWLHARYRLSEGPATTAIAGLSLGGLAAFDLAWTHPEIFGAVGVLSGSFWWRSDNTSVATKIASRIMHRKIREAATNPPIRAWLQAGTHDETSDRDGDGVIDAIQDTTELIDAMVARGYTRGLDLAYREVPGGRHEPATWARVLPEFLLWLAPLGR
jgi:enterochelin esterase-like enzyme